MVLYKNFILVIAIIAFITNNNILLSKRIDNMKFDPFFVTFEAYSSFLLANIIIDLKAKTLSSERVTINVSDLREGEWPPLVKSFVPKKTSSLYPLFMNTQVFLDQLSNRKIKIVTTLEEADIYICGELICSKNGNAVTIPHGHCINDFYKFPFDGRRAGFFNSRGIDKSFLLMWLMQPISEESYNFDSFSKLSRDFLLRDLVGCNSTK